MERRSKSSIKSPSSGRFGAAPTSSITYLAGDRPTVASEGSAWCHTIRCEWRYTVSTDPPGQPDGAEGTSWPG